MKLAGRIGLIIAAFWISDCARANGKPDLPACSAVAWPVVRKEIESLICIIKVGIPDQERFDAPSYWDRGQCGLPLAATPLERAVEKAYADARPAMAALSQDDSAVLAALRIPDSKARLDSVRRLFLNERFLEMLLPRLHAALAEYGLRCRGCPRFPPPERQTIDWNTFAPYLSAYVWPDPVITPRDSSGRAVGEPEYSAHICVGFNGVRTLRDPDPRILEAAFLAALHTPQLIEAAMDRFEVLKKSQELRSLEGDEAQTAYLEAGLGPAVASDPSLKPFICASLARFRKDTGVTVRGCGT